MSIVRQVTNVIYWYEFLLEKHRNTPVYIRLRVPLAENGLLPSSFSRAQHRLQS
jgi:hypothetical protein